MKVQFRASPKFVVGAEGNTHKEVFEELAGLSEVFSNDTCGACQSSNTLPIVRTVDGNNFYEMACRDCRARLSFGQSKTGGSLYPRRRRHDKHPDVVAGRAEADSWLPGNGWVVYNPRDND